MHLLQDQVEQIIDWALAEELSSGDVTTDTLIQSDWQGKAYFVVKASGVLAGIEIAERVFLKVDPDIKMECLLGDGAGIRPGDVPATVQGSLASILKTERTAVNFLQHLSGIASETARFIAAVSDLPVQILDTRKTLPGLRLLEKYAVRVGGGHNHRLNLGDGILIKDNHLAMLQSHGLDLKEVVSKSRREAPFRFKTEVEVTTPEEALQAAEAGAEVILLDNMSVENMRRAVGLIKGRSLIEASGNITLANVREVAETGVNFISSGSITHSVKALDISLEFDIGKSPN
jgi:nicotinate-nucleotide pyrophosphorylase (carboxylating)